MADTDHPFKPGTEVILQDGYSHYGPGKFRKTKVLKLHKTGRFTLECDPGQQWYAQKHWDDKESFGHKTSSSNYTSIYSSRCRLMSADAMEEWRVAKEDALHTARCIEITKALARPEKVSKKFIKEMANLIVSSIAI